jgi:hypothetical protein
LTIAAAWAFDPVAFDGGEEYTPAAPLRGDSFIAQQPAGVRWLHVHPEHLIDDRTALVLRLAGCWRDGTLPEAGGVAAQSAWTVAAIDIVLGAWSRLREARESNHRRE